MMQTKMATMMTSTITLPAHGSLIAGQGIVLFDLPIGSVDHADDDAAIIRTAIKPATAAPTFSVEGAVTRVPMV